MTTSPNPDIGAKKRSVRAASKYPPEATLLRDHSPALEFLKDKSGRLVYCNKTFESVFSAATLMESSHDAVVATTVDGLVVSWNAGAAEMYGYPAAEMLGRSISILEAPEHGGEPQDVRKRIQAGESVVRFDAVRLHRDGTTVDVAVSVSPIRNASGDLVGFASIARDISECKRSEELITMYRAKERGRNNSQLSTPELSEEAIKRLDLQAGLRQALERQELFLHYQPVLSLTTGKITELEALVRWQHPEKGLIMPAAFIDVAEKAGMMVPLGHWVLGKAASQLRIWQERGYTDMRVAINLSPSQFHERNLASTVQQALADSALKPETLEIEITEGVAMEDAEVTVANLLALRDLKVGISIDDFGTGYSSLSYLKKFPVTTLKIDQSFVSDVATNSADAGIVHAVVAMAHGLNLNVIAEGVETKEQFAYLKDSGCDALQGYWFCRPQPVEAVDVLLAEEQERWSPRA